MNSSFRLSGIQLGLTLSARLSVKSIGCPPAAGMIPIELGAMFAKMDLPKTNCGLPEANAIQLPFGDYFNE